MCWREDALWIRYDPPMKVVELVLEVVYRESIATF